MSPRKILILAIVLAVLAGLAYWQKARQADTRPTVEGVAAGDLVLPDFDVNGIASVTLRTATSTATLARVEGTWKVASLFNYPADFPRVAEFLRALADLRVGQVVRDGESMLADFGLDTAHNAIEVEMAGDGGARLAALTIGSPKSPAPEGGFMGMPMTRYLRVGEGPVIAVNEGLNRLTTRGADWIKADLLQVMSTDVKEVEVTTPDSSYVLKPGGEAQYVVDGMAENEEVDMSNAARLTGALQFFRISGVADPALTDDATGVANASVYILKAADGFEYTIRTGGNADDGASRYAQIEVAWTRPEPPARNDIENLFPPPSEEHGDGTNDTERRDMINSTFASRMKEYEERVAADEKGLAALKASVDGWTFLIPQYSADTLTLPRSQVVKEKTAAEPAKVEK